MKVQLTVCICKNLMVKKYIFVGKPIFPMISLAKKSEKRTL